MGLYGDEIQGINNLQERDTEMDDKNYILIVEDSPTQAQQVETILCFLDHPCKTAGSAKEALEFIKKQKPLIVVADILMPEMDGYELCRRIKGNFETRHIPVVLLTRLSEPRDIIKGLECGADDFIIKPYNEEIILTRIQTVLSLRQKQEAASKQENILIVEDSPTQAEQIKFLLEEEGYSVLTASNGAEGFEIAKEVGPSLIISDIIMPVMDGFELANKIKNDDALKNTPIIFLTSLQDSKLLVQKVSVVADGFFTKPFDENYLLSKIQFLIAASQHRLEDMQLKGIEINFWGEWFVINAGFRQVVNFLLSTYEGAIRQNSDLVYMQRELQQLNQQLESKVLERTEKLKSSEENFRALAENSGDGILIAKAPDVFIYANHRMSVLTGYSESELMNMPCKDIIIPADADKISAKCKKMMMTGKPFSEQFETSILSKDNIEIPIEITTSGTIWEGEPAIMIFFRDVTDRKKRVEDIIRKDKLESVGVLAGGIAHDFNNLLTGILGNISMVLMEIVNDKKNYSLLADAEKATLRARDLTWQLLTFSKGGAPLKEASYINELIEESAMFALRGSKIICNFSLHDDLRLVEVDKGQFSQVINNLVLNAKQAMINGGTLSISAENTEVRVTDNLPLDPGRYVKISVKDTGTGIPKDILPMIFDPYFTTKVGGSGLGLASVYSIVKNHEGYITVESNPGEGTVFYIYLPVSLQKAPVVKHAEEQFLHGTGRVLIMDDEEIIRELTEEMLKKLGYDVVSAKDGREAIELYKNAMHTGSPFSAVIMDLTVPGGMGGAVAIKKLIEEDPSVKAIVSSGYSNDIMIAEYKKYGFSGFIVKPYRFSDLSRVVHEVITGIRV
ncbi:MAG: response regulator [Nitrospirae bacterium]|nr:response regulator [Nitrospirota bacterium]